MIVVNRESLLLGGSRRAVRKRKKNLNRERARNVAPDAKKQQEKLGGNQQQPRKRSPSLSENAPGVGGLSESCRYFSGHVFGTFLGRFLNLVFAFSIASRFGFKFRETPASFRSRFFCVWFEIESIFRTSHDPQTCKNKTSRKRDPKTSRKRDPENCQE